MFQPAGHFQRVIIPVFHTTEVNGTNRRADVSETPVQ